MKDTVLLLYCIIVLFHHYIAYLHYVGLMISLQERTDENTAPVPFYVGQLFGHGKGLADIAAAVLPSNVLPREHSENILQNHRLYLSPESC